MWGAAHPLQERHVSVGYGVWELLLFLQPVCLCVGCVTLHAEAPMRLMLLLPCSHGDLSPANILLKRDDSKPGILKAIAKASS